MRSLLPWGSKEPVKTTELSVVSSKAELVESASDDVVVYQGRSKGIAVQVRSKTIMVAGNKRTMDPQQLMRMIKQVTQTIGEYKGKDNAYSDYVVGALRKARSDMVSDLESNFNIHWEIDERSGKSNFWM